MKIHAFPQAADAVITSSIIKKLNSMPSDQHLTAWAVASIGASFFALTEFAMNAALAVAKLPFVTVGLVTGYQTAIGSREDFVKVLTNMRRALLIQWQAIGVLFLISRPSVMLLVGRSVGLLEVEKTMNQMLEAQKNLQRNAQAQHQILAQATATQEK